MEHCWCTIEQARAKVMMEFPDEFKPSKYQMAQRRRYLAATALEELYVRSWNAAIICDGFSAGDLASWLVKEGLEEDVAKHRVIQEHPDRFGVRWDPDINCGGWLSKLRVEWVVDVCAVSPLEARRRVMSEYLHLFLKPNIGELNNDKSGGHSCEALKPKPDKDLPLQGIYVASRILDFLISFTEGAEASIRWHMLYRQLQARHRGIYRGKDLEFAFDLRANIDVQMLGRLQCTTKDSHTYFMRCGGWRLCAEWAYPRLIHSALITAKLLLCSVNPLANRVDYVAEAIAFAKLTDEVEIEFQQYLNMLWLSTKQSIHATRQAVLPAHIAESWWKPDFEVCISIYKCIQFDMQMRRGTGSRFAPLYFSSSRFLARMSDRWLPQGIRDRMEAESSERKRKEREAEEAAEAADQESTARMASSSPTAPARF